MSKTSILAFVSAICIIFLYPQVAQSADEIKGKRIKSTNTVKTINPNVLKDIKKVGQIKMLSNTEYQKKLKAHDLRVKSKAKGVNVNARANTRLKSQNTAFDELLWDCNDRDPAINPQEKEVCDGKDNDCNGDVDDGVLNTYYLDADSDLWGDPSKEYYACAKPRGYSDNVGDCNDKSPAIHPGAANIPNNQVDENCDGRD